jgi:hypothetical protein
MPPHRRLCNILALLALAAACAAAQPFRREVATIPVTHGADTIAMPFAGGINTPEHQWVDIDGDGDLDLFVYDADLTGTLSFFRNTGTPRAPRFALEPHGVPLPPFQAWFLFADLDGDGRVDLATDDSLSGIRYYRNEGTAAVPSFVLAASPLRDTSGVAVNAGFGNVPTFADINGGGRLDFFSNNGADGSINFYKNVGTTSAPAFAFVTSSFQHIIVLGDQCTTAVAAKNVMHGSGALSFVDIDANGTKDLFHGDQFFTGLFFMENSGTPADPHILCTSNAYPPAAPVATFGFNQPTFADIDGDGDLDLFVGVLNNMFRHGFWFYRNAGDSTAPDFRLETRDFLSMIDVGRDAVPAIADLDGDGDLDILVGNVNGQLSYFRNTGTPSAPAFDLADTLFAGITGNSAYAPALADVDHDGMPDLFLGRFDGKVLLYRNTGGGFAPSDSLTGTQYAAPAAADLDGDGDVDLLVGRGNGRLSFYRNDAASPGAFAPTLISAYYDSIDAGDDARPALVFDPSRRVFDLFIGNSEGNLFYYRNEGDSARPDFRLVTSSYGAVDPVRELAPAFGDLDGDGDLDLVLGTLKGGLHFYRNDFTSGVGGEGSSLPASLALLQNYPNPFNPVTNIAVEVAPGSGADEYFDLAVYDLAGRRMATLLSGPRLPGTYRVRWDPAGAASGAYYCRLATARGAAVTKMIFIK